ncbi:general substrate transporter [Polychaeton citri CBS 116435]|uniref:General substrate transporter n=1 Tax=Polychaeton citri CBS 116435 TaxID=1314669 RepID=A0A9P4Q174_9PEZI|nr:general substrate transporter [Polychaeton citri CBS 116435]
MGNKMMVAMLTEWMHLKRYVFYSLVISFGGLLFGLDTGCIGPITTMPQFNTSFGNLSSTVHGLVVSSILIPAAIASFFAGPLADHVGRPLGISIGALLFTLGTALEAGSNGLAMLFIGRIITGAGEGLFLSTILVYICEIAPARERGMLASIQQFLTTFGICMGYFVCYGTVTIPTTSLSWRLPFAIQSFLSLVYAGCALCLLPQSPRWLSSKGRIVEADLAWSKLGISGVEREKAEEEQTSKSMQVEVGPEIARIPSNSINTGAITGHTLFRVFAKDVRMRTLLGVFMSGFQQLSGIDGVLYYAPLLFHQAGLNSSTASFLASGISALLMMLITIPAFLFADKWGRRTSTILGGLLLSGCMIVIGSLYASSSVHSTHGAGRWAVIVLIYIFALVYCSTWGVTVRVHSAEIQPLKTRAAASSLAQSSNWAMNWIVAFTTPIFLARSTYGVYFFFGGCTLVATWVCAVAMPETKGRSLEDIDSAFDQRRSLPVSSIRDVTVKLMRSLSRRFLSNGLSSNQSSIELRSL